MSGVELVVINPLSSVKDTGYKMSPHFRACQLLGSADVREAQPGGRKVNIRSVWEQVCED